MTPIRVLFVCTGNSARSIIAEAILKHEAGGTFDAHSAGTQPKGVNPFTSRVLHEAGIDITGFRSKTIDEFAGQSFDYVITVCDAAAEECPIFPGPSERIHWSFPDPAAVQGSDSEKLAAFQQTLTAMREQISSFLRHARHVRR